MEDLTTPPADALDETPSVGDAQLDEAVAAADPVGAVLAVEAGDAGEGAVAFAPGAEGDYLPPAAPTFDERLPAGTIIVKGKRGSWRITLPGKPTVVGHGATAEAAFAATGVQL